MKEKIADILTEILERKISPEDINDDTNIISDFGLGSLDMMHFALDIEHVFGVEVNFEEIDFTTFFTYQTLKEYIENEIQ